MTDLRIADIERWSTVDWPDEIVATVFCRGCNWACPYCHNPGLRQASGDTVPWTEVLAFLATRRGLLDGVVFSGGEPLLQSALPAAMAEVKAMGFGIGLHTGGPSPERFAAVLPLLDWVGFDVKAPFAEYETIAQVPHSGEAAQKSLQMLLASDVACQLRTTVHPKLTDAATLDRLNRDLSALGAGPTVVQPFRAQGCIDPTLV